MLTVPPAPPAPDLLVAGCRPPLTSREIEVLMLVVDGLSNPQIAARLHVSPRTVQSHVAAAMRKLDARSRTQLAVLALRTGIVPLHPHAPLRLEPAL